MKRTSCRALAAASVVVLLLCTFCTFCEDLFGVSSSQAAIYTLDGRCLQASLVAVDGKGMLRLQGASDVDAIPFSSVHMISFPTRSAEFLGEGALGVLLQGGDYLTGVLTGGNAEKIVLDNPLLGLLDIPIDSMQMLLPGMRDIPADFGRYALSADEDVVYRKSTSGFGEDFISGTVDLFSGKGLTFECSLGLVDFSFGQLNAVVISSAGAESRAENDTFVLLRGGAGRVTGSFKGLENGRLSLDGSFLPEFSLPVDVIESISFRRDSMLFVSDLEPTGVDQTPYLGASEDFLFPFQRDRSVSGRELVCGGQRFAKGLGVHSRAVLTWDLEEPFASFQAFVGISDETLDLRAHGSIRFRVQIDGRKVFESPILRGGDGVVFLPLIPLEGAKTLTLEADFADGFDSGDRGLWGQAFLLK